MPMIEVRNLTKHFPIRGGVLNRVQKRVHAVNDVSFDIASGETLGVVGESGCGKSTLGKTIIRLLEPTAGTVVYEGDTITGLSHSEMMPFRRKMQIIFQDPYSSLNPRTSVNAILKEAITLHQVLGPRESMDTYIDGLMRQVGLRPDDKTKFPHEFSGGQRQRIGIARALSVKPSFIVADEPVSALDVSIQAQVLNLMKDLKEQLGLTMMFISHDLKVVEHFCDRVLVMYLGNLVEELSTEHLDRDAKHPYTRALLGAGAIDDPNDRRPLTVLEGDVPSPIDPPPGCPFHQRCPQARPICREAMPPLDRWKAGEASDVPQIIDVDRAHPLMRFIELGNVIIAEGRPITPPQGGNVLIDADVGALLAIAPRAGFEDAVLGFEILGVDEETGDRYANTDWVQRRSFPLFVDNVLEYLGRADVATTTPGVKPGKTIRLRTEAPVDTISIRSPGGRASSIPRGGRSVFAFNGTEEIGVYDVREGGASDMRQQFAVNLFDSRESDIRAKPAIQMGYEEVAAQPAWQPMRQEAWKWFLLAAIVVLGAEWYIFNRRVYL